MADISKHLAESYPDQSGGWMNWAFALREMDMVQKAKDVTLQGLKLHPDEAILHFNLACYLSLLGSLNRPRSTSPVSVRASAPVWVIDGDG